MLDLSFLNLRTTLLRTTLAVHIITAGFLTLTPLNSAHADTAAESAIRLIQNEDWEAARVAVSQSGNPILFKLYEWSLYRDQLTNLPYDRIVTFITQNPTWPDQKLLCATAERNMPQTLSSGEILSWFISHPPVTGEGILRLIEAGNTAGQTESINGLVNAAWAKADMSQETQMSIMSSYGNLISISANEARIDTLIKNSQYKLSRSLASAMGRGYPRLVEARIALAEDKGGADDLVYEVPQNLQSNTGLLYDRIRWLRRHDSNDGAASLLASAANSSQISYPQDWWKERNILVRRLIEDKNYRKAYELASRHGMGSGQDFAEAEWLSGWLALRFLRSPEAGLQHFMNMYAKVETSISKSRGAYWAGRASEAMGKAEEARAWYYQAASYPHTYYGQIALGHLKMSAPPQTPATSSPTESEQVATSDLVRAAVLLHQSGYETLSAKFISAKLDLITTPGEYQAFAQLLKSIGDTSGAYRVAKRAGWKNYFLGDVAYPSLMSIVDDINIDPALAHGIIRQESQFDTSAESPSGALGLMQLMPGTASEIARKRGWDHQTEWLTSRPAHNVLLGSAYLNDLLKRFNGSYPLAIAAYNAGPTRVKGWLEAFGDPRAGDINWIDWLELIPVAETRNYVQRVTEGLVTYRDHLGMK